jgi:genome maintenance exonuclease 1
MLVNKFDYPALRRVQTKKGRQYVGEDQKPVPSVTTILSDTGDKTALIAWRKRVGEAEATRISTEAAGLGTKVHNALEKHILGETVEFGNNMVSVMAKDMSEAMINEGFTNIDELWGVEVGLIAQGLYAGTSDAIGVYEGEDAIIDFKTAKKMKKREWIDDYFMQGCAYALAHNEMFDTNIKKVAILMVDRDSNFKDFVIEGEEFDKYCDIWSDRLADYYSKNS